MKIFEPLLFDTNILVYNQDKDSQLYPQASSVHKKVFEGEIVGVISSQNLLEFAAVMINPKKIVKPLSQQKAALEIEKYIESGSFETIYPKNQTISVFIKLLRKYQLRNPRHAFDLFLVATMLSNNVKSILTVNEKDFDYDEIKVVGLSLFCV